MGSTAGVLLVLALVATACGETANDAEPAPAEDVVSAPADVAGPEPADMCGVGEAPVVAAYDRASGEHLWTWCGSPASYHTLDAVSDEIVYVDGNGISAVDGTLAHVPPPIPDDAVRGMSVAPTIDGVALSGGQDDPTTAVDVASGRVLWSVSAHLPYDDVWAVGDGAVFLLTFKDEPDQPPESDPTVIAAHEITTGDVRWESPVDEIVFPYYADDDAVYALWSNLWVLSTDDGSLIWKTSYAATPSGFPRMTGALPLGDRVYVSFTSQSSGGD